MSAAEIEAAIATLEGELVAGQKRLVILKGQLRQERDREFDRKAREGHERIRFLQNGAEACCSIVTSRAGVRGWFIGVGRDGRLLGAYEVTEYRGERTAVRVLGSPIVPQSVELALMSVFDLKIAR